MTVTASSSPVGGISPSMAWLTLFLPALSYFLSTRMDKVGISLFRSSSLGTPTVSIIEQVSSCETLRKVFYVNTCREKEQATLSYSLNLVQEKGLEHVVSTSWRHDSELGRGYLLISDAGSNGRIWRWEVGGGPIAIGKTLHLEQAGCRSNLYRECDGSIETGSGGIAIDFANRDHFQEGLLVVAEWGEGRIIRLEDNGARTPIVMHLPSEECNNATVSRRVERPSRLLYTPFGDLLFIDQNKECNTSKLYRLRYAVHVHKLSSLEDSRKAHTWTKLEEELAIPERILSKAESIGDIVIAPDWTSVLAAVSIDGSALLLRYNEGTDHDERVQPENIVMNLTAVDASIKVAHALVVDKNGFVFWSSGDVLLVLDIDQSTVVGHLKAPSAIRSMTLGGDGFLYMATMSALYRIRLRSSSVKIPTNVVVRPEPKQNA